MSPRSTLLTVCQVMAVRRPRIPRPLTQAATTLAASAGLAGALLLTLVPSAESDLGCCPQCGTAVLPTDPFLRYRGDYYHAHDCVEFNPPAISQARTARK